MQAVAANIQALEQNDAPESRIDMVIPEEFVYIFTITANKLELFILQGLVWPCSGLCWKTVLQILHTSSFYEQYTRTF